MAIPGRLTRKLHDTLGNEAGDDMVQLLQGFEVQRSDLRDLRDAISDRLDTRLNAFRGELRQEMSAGFTQVRQETVAGLAELRQEMVAGFAEVRQEMGAGLAEVRQEMAAGLADVRQEMAAGFAEVRQEMATRQELAQAGQEIAMLARHVDQGFGRMEALIERRFADLMKWSFVFWIGSVVALVGALTAVNLFLR